MTTTRRTTPPHPAPADATWTAERANNALPLVRRIADDIVLAYRRWQELVEQFELAALRSTPDRPDPEAEALQQRVQQAAREVQGFEAELNALGIECKSYELGLIDFPGVREGEPVYFCWQRGEPSVAHWHNRDAGFAGRQPL